MILVFDIIIIAVGFMLKPTAILMFKTGVAKCFFAQRGIICPSCGGTRCVYNFVNGNFSEAFGYHAGVFMGLIYLFAIIFFMNLYYLFNLDFARKIYRTLTDCRLIGVLVILHAIYGLSRNFI